MTQHLSDRDYEVLCAYLDGELPHHEQVKLEFRLRHQPDLQTALDELRQTSLLLRKLPQKRAPRNFTIQPAMVRQRAVPRAFPALRLASVLASLLFVIAFASDLITSHPIQSLSAMENVPTSAAGSRALQTQAPAATEAPAVPAAAPLAPPTPTQNQEAPLLMQAPAATQTPGGPADLAAGSVMAPTDTPAGIAASPTPTAEPTSAPYTALGVAPPRTKSSQPQTPAATLTPSEQIPVVTGTYGLGGGPGPEVTGSTETPTPEPTPLPPTETAAPETRQPTPTGTVLPASPGETAQAFKSAAGSEIPPATAVQSGAGSPTSVLPGFTRLPTALAPVLPAPAAARPVLRAMEFFFAGLAVLTGLAALLVRILPH